MTQDKVSFYWVDDKGRIKYEEPTPERQVVITEVMKRAIDLFRESDLNAGEIYMAVCYMKETFELSVLKVARKIPETSTGEA